MGGTTLIRVLFQDRTRGRGTHRGTFLARRQSYFLRLKSVKEKREDGVNEGSRNRKQRTNGPAFQGKNVFYEVFFLVSSENVFGLKALIYRGVCNLKTFPCFFL